MLEKTTGSNPKWFAGSKMSPGISSSGAEEKLKVEEKDLAPNYN